MLFLYPHSEFYLMKRLIRLIFFVIIVSCGRKNEPDAKIITVSIAPFKYFAEAVSGSHFKINVMVPPGANPHIYEPYPEQVNKLSRSVAYISNGYLGFEMTWLDRFYEINRKMKKLSLGEGIELIKPDFNDKHDHAEKADPHYWISPLCAKKMAASIKDFLIDLDPENKEEYLRNFQVLYKKICIVDSLAMELASYGSHRAFMIYHPNLAYLARDYGLEEIPFEFNGKEPDPSRMIKLVDRAKKDLLKIILVQREYDTKNARAIAEETGAEIVIIDPLSEDWYSSTVGIINVLRKSFEKN